MASILSTQGTMPIVRAGSATLHLRYELLRWSDATDPASLSPSAEELVVLHHGHMASLETWQACAASLMGRRRDRTNLVNTRVLLLDCRGAGRSSHPRGRSNYSIKLLAEDVVLLVDALFSPTQKFCFCGHSMGGVIGKILASEVAPDRLTRLICVASAPSQGIRGIPDHNPSQLAKYAAVKKEVAAAKSVSDLYRQKPDGAFASLCREWIDENPLQRQEDPEALAFVQRFVSLSLAASDDHHQFLWQDMERLRVDLKRIVAARVPTLVVAGAADSVLRHNLADYKALHRTASLHVFSGVGHGIPRETPDQLAEVMDGFLSTGVISAQTVSEQAERRQKSRRRARL